jgi:CRISPR-associated protein Cmr5
MTQSTLPTHQQTLQQQRARHAYDRVAQVIRAPYAKEYGSEVRRLPAMIQTDGLGAALAFLKAKGKDQHIKLYEHVQEWLRHAERFSFTGDLIDWLLNQPTSTYRMVGSETLAYTAWLKRFAEANDLRSDE